MRAERGKREKRKRYKIIIILVVKKKKKKNQLAVYIEVCSYEERLLGMWYLVLF